MALVADGLMVAAALVAAIYCFVLSTRVRNLSSLDRGLGAAIAGLSRQVDGMQEALGEAKRVSGASVRDLRDLTARAEVAAGRLELLLATLHDREGSRPAPLRPRSPRPEPEDEPAPRARPNRPADPAAVRASLRQAFGTAEEAEAPAPAAAAPAPAPASAPASGPAPEAPAGPVPLAQHRLASLRARTGPDPAEAPAPAAPAAPAPAAASGSGAARAAAATLATAVAPLAVRNPAPRPDAAAPAAEPGPGTEASRGPLADDIRATLRTLLGRRQA